MERITEAGVEYLELVRDGYVKRLRGSLTVASETLGTLRRELDSGYYATMRGPTGSVLLGDIGVLVTKIRTIQSVIDMAGN